MEIVKTKQTCRHSFFELREDPDRPGKQKPVWECHHKDKAIRDAYANKVDGCATCPAFLARN